ncbi:3-isopropylmalate dehydratase small subunit [Phytohabitans kaempferiae]|uniref:3-isopropylmalate dehydratase small subunit n=1 Tax=Phytohabitans kaempferiae TaxID=1620943 RepID=A0ABV6M911_9ACTN
MDPVSIHTGRGLPLHRNDVDTDQIIPAEFCKRLTKSGYADALFAHWRTEADFVFNQPDREGASVLVAAHNFGTGSSREHAVWALRDWGVRAVVASSFGDIFQRNALKNALLPVELPEAAVTTLRDLVEADPAAEISVDLVACQVRAGTLSWAFTIGRRERWLLLNGYDDIDVTLQREPAIAAYEKERRRWLPEVHRGSFSSASTA